MTAGREVSRSGIRALERDDLTGVCELFEQVMGSGGRTPDPRLAGYFERLFFDDPWADPAIPPLVYTAADGEVVGFIGVNTRRMRLDGRAVRVAVSSNLVAHPDWRSRGVGALLLRRLLAGPQEMTIADRSNDESRGLWSTLGGQELVHASVGWYRILRPGASVGGLLELRGRRGRVREVARRLGGPVDAVIGAARRLPRLSGLTALEPAAPAEGVVEPMGPDDLVEHVRDAGRHLRLHPDYDAGWARWLFAELDRLHAQGRTVARVVRGRRGQVLGWFVYLLAEGGVAQVLQVGVPGNDRELVLDHLVHQAWVDGAAALTGRLEPVTSGMLGRPGVVVRASARALVHAEDPVPLALLGSTASLMSHLDGEWLVSHARRL